MLSFPYLGPAPACLDVMGRDLEQLVLPHCPVRQAANEDCCRLAVYVSDRDTGERLSGRDRRVLKKITLGAGKRREPKQEMLRCAWRMCWCSEFSNAD